MSDKLAYKIWITFHLVEFAKRRVWLVRRNGEEHVPCRLLIVKASISYLAYQLFNFGRDGRRHQLEFVAHDFDSFALCA
ncbi:Unknown protein sequence [Pseudomonas amygdali pv. lachrymans]|uniref:Uncharacterized protein n=1 Tax=Pseudomonas amygdali pv. lachrymans TaxID=53707 RepID=A0A0P9UEX5_PSEAV|nr:Unknown protein sequence [Pseudomonas amygdali pv. lachrymans]